MYYIKNIVHYHIVTLWLLLLSYLYNHNFCCMVTYFNISNMVTFKNSVIFGKYYYILLIWQCTVIVAIW